MRGCRWLGVEHLVHQRSQSTIERTLAGQQLVQHDPGRVDIGASVRHLPHELFRGHVGRRTEHRADLRHAAHFEARNAEVGDLHPPVQGHHDVGGLDIAVHDTAVVTELQPGEQIIHDPLDVRHREPLVIVQGDLQRRSIDEFHDDVGDISGFAVVVDRHDVGMREPSGRLRLAPEPRDLLNGLGVGVGGQVDRLDRDTAGDRRIPAIVHRAHGTFAERAPNLVFPQGLGGVHGHPRCSCDDYNPLPSISEGCGATALMRIRYGCTWLTRLRRVMAGCVLAPVAERRVTGRHSIYRPFLGARGAPWPAGYRPSCAIGRSLASRGRLERKTGEASR